MQVIHLGQKELAERWQYVPQACQPCRAMLLQALIAWAAASQCP